jgi:hypothetical protein
VSDAVSEAAERAAAHAEVVRLAAALGVEPDDIAYLEEVDPAAVRALCERTIDVLHDSGAEGFRRIATAARVIPASLAASVAERALGPVSCALIAGAVDAGKAVDIARRLRPEFLAAVAVHADPRRIGELIGGLPPDRIVRAAVVLVREGHHVTVARLAAALHLTVVHAVVAEIADHDVLRTAFFLDDDSHLDGIAAGLADERLIGLVRAARDAELWMEGVALVARLGEAQRERIGSLVDAHEPSLRAELAARGLQL